MPLRTVTIVGVGLIGGSFALALRKAGFEGRIIGVSRPETIAEARELGVIDEGASLEQALPESDLIYLAQPILRILEQLPEVARLAGPGALVTDAGSTKQAIVESAREHFRNSGAAFLGGHPMAGKEGRGVAIAEADLFHGAVYAITPEPEMGETPWVDELLEWIRRIGARPLAMTPAEHDCVTAMTSHAATGLHRAGGGGVGSLENPEQLQVAGGGLRDMTRLAGSSYAIWEGILRTNAPAIAAGLRRVAAELDRLGADLEDPAVAERFSVAQSLHKKLRHS